MNDFVAASNRDICLIPLLARRDDGLGFAASFAPGRNRCPPKRSEAGCGDDWSKQQDPTGHTPQRELAPAPAGDGQFELLIVTEDQRHSVPTTAADLTALATVIREGVVLLWDLEGQVLIIGNLLGEWIPLDWSSN